MNIDFKPFTLKYENRIRNLDTKASGVVKSEKFFPVFELFGKEIIFKPLSKSKPFMTGLYSYSEVFWSNVINEYFSEAPRYILGICEGYEKETKKYLDKGCFVGNIIENDEECLVNLYEYFKDNPDEKVNINDYINYCMTDYDYTCIFESKLFKKNKELSENLALQVLISILKADQNFHYENVAFICDKEKNIKSLAPMIDHEFSNMFLFPDNPLKCSYYFTEFLLFLEIGNNAKNISYICEHFPDVAKYFLKKTEILREDIKNFKLENQDFLFPWNSDYYKVGIARFKENNEQKAKELESEIEMIDMDLKQVNENLIFEIDVISKTLIDKISKKLNINN